MGKWIAMTAEGVAGTVYATSEDKALATARRRWGCWVVYVRFACYLNTRRLSMV